MNNFMERAIALGEKGRITAPPNPWVGCVIVKEGRVVGEGFHARAGEPHAEVMALRQAGILAEGATAFVTLEPCCHFGRTPPCVKALIEAKISQVVVSVEDPDQRVAGKGLEALKNAGVTVTSGVMQEKTKASLLPYLHHRKTGLPYCVAKAAISIDGRTAAMDRSSQWITSEGARRDAHLLRARSQAILIGSGSALSDRPRLTVRDVEPMPPEQPLRVVLDSNGRVPQEGPLFDSGKTIIFTSIEMQSKCEVIQVAKTEEGVDLREVLHHLGKRGVIQLLIEGGATILGSFMKASLLQELVLYMGPCILGDQGVPLFQDVSVPNIGSAHKLKLIDICKIEEDVRIHYARL